ncbi:MAG: N-methyl-L-tryptophan oxidase [Casimicrobiaceae bacterium]
MAAYDVIVIGLGATGSAAAYQLAKRGRRVLGLDRHAPPHEFGSSHGDTRITRRAIGEGAHYSPLAMRSHEIWRELERETGATLLDACGLLVLSGSGATAFTHVPGFFANTIAAAERFGIAHEMLDAAAIRARFPAFGVRDDERAYFEPGAGFLRPEACVRANLQMAQRGGAALHMSETARSLAAAPGGVTVTTDRATYHAGTLILAAGPWLPGLVDASLARHFSIHRQALFWFDVDGPIAPFERGRFPAFIWELSGRPQSIYGFPAIDGRQGGVKIATESYAATTTPDTVERAVTPEEIAKTHADYIAPFFPAVSARCLRATTCLYTVTRDFGFVVDRHPEMRNVIVASPCSGHGFKHSAALGEALADLADNGTSPIDLRAFSFARFD